MGAHPSIESAIVTAIERYFGKAVRCTRMPHSSSASVFLAQQEARQWIVKLFSREEKDTAIRSIEAMHELTRCGAAVPTLVSTEPFAVAAGFACAYEYISGSCLRDSEQTLSSSAAAGSLIAKLTRALKRCWDEGRLTRDLYGCFDLPDRLRQGVEFMSRASPLLSSEIKQRIGDAGRLTRSSTPVHADLHAGNVLATSEGLVAIDFNSMCYGSPEKAFAAFVGKTYERESCSDSHGMLVQAVIRGGEENGVELDPAALRLCALEKKMGEIRYLESLRPQNGLSRKRLAGYRDDATRGLACLLNEWEQFPV